MIDAAEIVRGIYRKMGRPSQADLPYQDVLDTVRDVERELRMDLKLAQRGHTQIIGEWQVPSNTEMPSAGMAGGLDNFIPIKVEWRFAGSTDFPYKAEVVSYEHLGDVYRKSQALEETYVAFYEGFSKIAFSETLQTLQSREYRIICQDMEDVPEVDINSQIQLPPLFITLCQDAGALKLIDLLRNESERWVEQRERLRTMLLMSLVENKGRFEQWRRSLLGNRKVRKLGYRPRLGVR